MNDTQLDPEEKKSQSHDVFLIVNRFTTEYVRSPVYLNHNIYVELHVPEFLIS